MPPQKPKSGLLAKLGDKLKKSHESHKHDDVELGRIDLPAGIDGGIAQLVECKFGEYKEGQLKGKVFFSAAGIVVSPDVHEGTPVKGLRTSIIEPLCDTPSRSRKTFDDHYKWIVNELKKLGVPMEDVTVDDLEQVVADLVEQGPHFRFRTWKGEPATTGPYKGKPPRVQHQWGGFVEFDTEATDDVQEDAADDEKATPEVEPDAEPEADEAGTEAATDEPNLAELAELADGDEDADGVMDAREQLTEIAKGLGIKEKSLEKAENWAEVVELIEAAKPVDEEEAAAEEEVVVEKGAVYGYLVIDPKTKKPVVDPKTKKPRKPVQCEVTAVDEAKQTCKLKNLDDNKTIYVGVKFDQLIVE